LMAFMMVGEEQEQAQEQGAVEDEPVLDGLGGLDGVGGGSAVVLDGESSLGTGLVSGSSGMHSGMGLDHNESIAEEFRSKIKEQYQTLWEAFQDFDADGDECISRNEFKAALVKVGMTLSEKDRKTLRSSIDKKKTKKVSYDDLMAFMMVGEEQEQEQAQEQGGMEEVELTIEQCGNMVAEHFGCPVSRLDDNMLQDFIFENSIHVDRTRFPHEKQNILFAIATHLQYADPGPNVDDSYGYSQPAQQQPVQQPVQQQQLRGMTRQRQDGGLASLSGAGGLNSLSGAPGLF